MPKLYNYDNSTVIYNLGVEKSQKTLIANVYYQAFTTQKNKNTKSKIRA